MTTFRTFRAPDTRSALAMVKASMGSEAVIVSTREVSGGLFRPKEIEVSAAVAVAVPAQKPAGASSYTSSARAPAPATAPEAPDLARVVHRALVNQRPTPVKPVTPNEDVTGELLRLNASMEQMRQEMKHMSGQVRLERELSLTPSAAEMMEHLVSRGVEEALADEAVRQAMAGAPNQGTATLLAGLRQALSERVVAGRAPWLPDSHRRVIALVGPTGVGKTTTLAKIAARAIMESKLKVALVTVDTYRIGASEQVTRYGEIMGVPTYVARDRLELGRVMEKVAGADLVLVDTAGRSVSEAVARQAELVRSIEGISLYLVVSACSGAREMAAAAERYRGLKPDRLVVTKVDEAVGPGSLLSASVRIGRPIVAVSDGQRVPEDIHALSSAELVDLVVGRFESQRHQAHVNVGGR